jgi:hypothetical protein
MPPWPPLGGSPERDAGRAPPDARTQAAAAALFLLPIPSCKANLLPPAAGRGSVSRSSRLRQPQLATPSRRREPLASQIQSTT